MLLHTVHVLYSKNAQCVPGLQHKSCLGVRGKYFHRGSVAKYSIYINVMLFDITTDVQMRSGILRYNTELIFVIIRYKVKICGLTFLATTCVFLDGRGERVIRPQQGLIQSGRLLAERQVIYHRLTAHSVCTNNTLKE